MYKLTDYVLSWVCALLPTLYSSVCLHNAQYVNKSIQEKYIRQVFDAVLCSTEIDSIQPKLGQCICIM